MFNDFSIISLSLTMILSSIDKEISLVLPYLPLEIILALIKNTNSHLTKNLDNVLKSN